MMLTLINELGLNNTIYSEVLWNSLSKKNGGDKILFAKYQLTLR